jgi:hypothetical protein
MPQPAGCRSTSALPRTANPAARTANARKAFADCFEREADPDCLLPPAERARRPRDTRRAA